MEKFTIIFTLLLVAAMLTTSAVAVVKELRAKDYPSAIFYLFLVTALGAALKTGVTVFLPLFINF